LADLLITQFFQSWRPARRTGLQLQSQKFEHPDEFPHADVLHSSSLDLPDGVTTDAQCVSQICLGDPSDLAGLLNLSANFD